MAALEAEVRTKLAQLDVLQEQHAQLTAHNEALEVRHGSCDWQCTAAKLQ